MKLNALFVGGDSLDYFTRGNKIYSPCTIHHLEFILLECPPGTFKAIISRVTTGTFPTCYTQNSYSLESGYIEMMLPPINIFDPNLVEHIHIGADHALPEQDRQAFKALGITVTNLPSSPYSQLGREFMAAIEEDDEKKVSDLLAVYPSLKKIANKIGELPIHIAAKCGSIKVLTFFAKCNFDFTVNSANDCSPLQLAAANGHLNALQLVIKIIQDKTQQSIPQIINTSKDSKKALHLAAQKNQAQIAAYLIEHGANINSTVSNGMSALHLAVFNQHETVIDVLLKHHINMEIKDKKNQRADEVTNAERGFKNILAERKNELLSAIQAGKLEMLKDLVEQNKGWISIIRESPALFLALKNGNLELIKFLMEDVQVDINQRINNPASKEHGATALYLAVNAKDTSDEIVQYLINKGANASIATYNGRTPLSSAAYHGMTTRVDMLTQAAIDLNPNQVTHKHKNSALIHAVEYGSVDTVSRILNVPKINVAYKRANGESALYLAIKKGDEKKINLILSKYVTVSNNFQYETHSDDLQKSLKLARAKGYTEIAYNIAKIYLPLYVNYKAKLPINYYKTSLSLFGLKKGFGYSALEKFIASNALQSYESNGKNGLTKLCLSKYKNALENGELGLITQSLGIKF